MDIITTIGPKSWSEEVVAAHIGLGVKCIRFPFAKETPLEHVVRCEMVKRIATTLGKEVHTMVDIPGGKPRLSNAVPLQVFAETTYRIALSSEIAERNDLYLDPPLPLNAFCERGIAI